MADAGEENVPLRHDGLERPCLLVVPDGTAPEGGWPLVVVAAHRR